MQRVENYALDSVQFLAKFTQWVGHVKARCALSLGVLRTHGPYLRAVRTGVVFDIGSKSLYNLHGGLQFGCQKQLVRTELTLNVYF